MPSIARKITQFTKKEIDLLFSTARRPFNCSNGLAFLIAPRTKTKLSRILIIANRKVGSAPERNKIRRRLKSIFYEEKLFNEPFDCVVIVYKQATSLSFLQLKELLLKAYKKYG